MFNSLDWLYPDGHAVAILFDEPGTPVLVFRTPQHMYMHASGFELQQGKDFIIIGGFADPIQAVDFAHSGGSQAVHKALWGTE